MRSRVVSEAPAKVNLTLEVLGKRADGYHEVRTILQTIRLGDYVELRAASELSLSVRGATRAFRRASREAPETNLAYQAAVLLQERAGVSAGAEIRLSKRIPVSAGLGGGSSDAAAVLRGLRDLWGLSISDEDLAAIAAELGSDVPFFLRGGSAFASGRGDVLAPLPDGPPQRLVLAWPERAGPADKTARMYAALRPEHYTDGSQTERLADRLRAGEPVRDEDVYNVFEQVLPEADSQAAETFRQAADLGLGQPHLAGSGPAFFFTALTSQTLDTLAGGLGLSVGLYRTRTAEECSALYRGA